MLTLWLIRHGETTGNARLPVAQVGNSAMPDTSLDSLALGLLTAQGQQQATKIAKTLTHPPDLIVTSPLWRTKQTAQPTCERFPDACQAEWAVQEFSYLAAEQYHNATPAERRLLDQDYWQRGDPEFISGEGAESFSSLMTRVKLLQDRLHQLEAETQDLDSFVLVFSHAWFMRAVIWSLMMPATQIHAEINAQQMWRLHHFAAGLPVPNGSIFKVQICASAIWFTGINMAHLSEVDSI